MGRYNEIVACINADPGALEPIFWEGPQGEVIASDWANGFLDAVALRPKGMGTADHAPTGQGL